MYVKPYICNKELLEDSSKQKFPMMKLSGLFFKLKIDFYTIKVTFLMWIDTGTLSSGIQSQLLV